MKSIFDALIGLFKRLWQDADPADGGHKVRIAFPTRDDVDVDMPQHARAGRLTDVHTDVKALRSVDILQDRGAAGGEFHHFGTSIWVEFFEAGDMLEWDD